MPRNCSTIASGVREGVGCGVSVAWAGVVGFRVWFFLYMTLVFLHKGGKAGGDIQDLSTGARRPPAGSSGDAPIPPVSDSRGVHLGRLAAGGASSTPAPVKAFVPSGKPLPPTAAGLCSFEVGPNEKVHPVSADVKSFFRGA